MWQHRGPLSENQLGVLVDVEDVILVPGFDSHVVQEPEDLGADALAVCILSGVQRLGDFKAAQVAEPGIVTAHDMHDLVPDRTV